MPELYDIFYNGRFACRVIKELLQDELRLLTSILPFDGQQTGITVIKVENKPLEKPDAPAPAEEQPKHAKKA